MKLTSFQLRTARTATRLSISQLSLATKISRATLLRIEKTPNLDYPNCHVSIMKRLQHFYETNGVQFLGEQSIYLMTETERGKFQSTFLKDS